MTALTDALSAELDDTLAAACRSAGLDPAKSELITYSSNAVYRVATEHGHDTIVRLNPHKDAGEKTAALVGTARWLEEQGAPITPLLHEITQPVLIDRWAATFWEGFPQPSRLTPGDLGATIRAFHKLAPRAGREREWNKFLVAHARLESADNISNEDREWLIDAWAEVERAYLAIQDGLPRGLIHGDAYLRNLVQGMDRPILCDLDGVSYGPIDWDLTPIAVSAIRFGPTSDHTEFADAYGRDVTNTAWWPVLRRIRELTMVTYVLPDLAGRPDTAQQWRWRMETLRAGHDDAPWQRY